MDETSANTTLKSDISKKRIKSVLEYQNISSDESGDAAIFVPKLMEKRLTLNDDINLNEKQPDLYNLSHEIEIDSEAKNSEATQRYSELDHICKGCEKLFKRIKQHLNHSNSCRKKYDMEELEKELKEQKRKQTSVRQMLHRKNAKKDDEEAFKESQTRKKQSQRCAERADDEEGFRHKLTR